MLGLLIHGLHWSLVLLGAGGAGYLLLPELRLPTLRTRRNHRPPPRSLTEHERALQLPTAAASGGPGEARSPRTPMPERPPPGRSNRWSDLQAVVATSSLSAGVIHAAVFPHHLRARVVVGLFFAVTAAAQVLWAVLATRSASTRLLHAGVAGNLFLVWLWAVSRTVGLPAGLADGHAGVGPWDLAAVVWELSVVAGCLALLRRPPAERPGTLTAVGRPAWLWAALSTAALILITLLAPHR